MIMNNSRREAYNSCQVLAHNQDELRLTGRIPAEPLLIGGAFHRAKQVIGSKSGNLDFAADEAEKEYRARANWASLLKEEIAIHESNISLVRSMVKAYGEHWINEKYQILAPEVSFRVALPNSVHHCKYFHKLVHPEDIHQNIRNDQGWAGNDRCDDERCWQPHFLVGTTDAIIQWNRAIWLMEHKTTAYDLYADNPQSKNWIANWYLSTQASTYIYGIWKSINVRPHGVLINVVIKPRKNAVTKVFSFYREAFLRSEEQLQRFETETIRLMNDYEARIPIGEIWMNPQSCFKYNRRCDFHKQCTSGNSDPSLITRDPDYVTEAYYKVLGIASPTASTSPKELPDNEQATTFLS